MNNENQQGTRHTFQDELRERCQQWWSDYEESVAQERLVTFDWPEILYEFVKGIALDSFKNGKAAGMRGPREQQRPYRPPANIKGTALQNGKLRPVQREA